MTMILYISGAVFLLILYMWSEAYRNRIRFHTLSFKQLPASFDGYRLFFISDVHRRLIPLAVRHKLKGHTDLVIIGGDLCEKGVHVKRIEENLKRLSSIAPCVFVWGNNDEEIGRDKLRLLFNQYQIVELNHSVKTIEINNEHIVIAGVDEVERPSNELAEVIAESKGSFAILVCHYPSIVDVLPSLHPFSLVLSGHTHGGQIRLFGWGLEKKGRLIVKPAYTHLISNGYGTTAVPMRLGAPAETHVIVLSKT